jgi:hypothetical protein
MPRHLIPFRTTATACVLAAGLALAGCGGSSSNSTSSTSTSQVPAGTYRGTVNLTVSARSASVSQSGPIVLAVSPAHVVTVGSYGSIPLAGNSFSVSAPASVLNGPNVSCNQGPLTTDGVFSGTTVTGTVSSTGVVCNGFPMTFSGNYVATLQHAEVPRGGSRDGDVMDVLRDAIRQALP